jgi:hypothetical protein
LFTSFLQTLAVGKTQTAPILGQKLGSFSYSFSVASSTDG